jgi:Ion channel
VRASLAWAASRPTTGAPHAAVRRPGASPSALPIRRRRGLAWRLLGTDNYALVLLLIVLSILVAAVADGASLPVPIPILFGATLLYALRTSAVAPRLQAAALLVVSASVLVALVSARVTGRTGAASGIDTGVTALLVVLTPLAIARRLISHPTIKSATVAGALCIYLLVGLFFAFVFGFIAAVGLGPFFVSQKRAEFADYLYFSYSTLTTLAYGDLTARATLGRMLAVTEALFGQMYLVSVVALLVSNFGRNRARR